MPQLRGAAVLSPQPACGIACSASPRRSASSPRSSCSRAWTDDQLKYALYHRIVDNLPIAQCVTQPRAMMPERTFEYWLAKVSNLVRLEVSKLPRLLALQYFDEWIRQYRRYGGRSYLSVTQEQNLIGFILKHDASNQPLVAEQVREAAQYFKMAATGTYVKKPGRKWFKRFIELHREQLDHRTIETKTPTRIEAEKAEIVREFIDRLQQLVNELHITEETCGQILAADETGFASDPHRNGRCRYVVARGRDSQRVAERALIKHTTLMHICDAFGISLPPMVMFKGVRIDVTAMPDAPAEAVFQFQTRGYFEAVHFIEVLRHIVRTHIPPAACTKKKIARDIRTSINAQAEQQLEIIESTVFCHRILIIDNAPCHRCPLAEAYANEHWIHIMYLPPNLTHLMQVSDVAVFAALKKCWYRIENSRTLIYTNGLKFTHQSFWTHLKEPWQQATKTENVRRGFRLCGQWPIDAEQVLTRMRRSKVDASGKSIDPMDDTSLYLHTIDEKLRVQSKQLRVITRENSRLRNRVTELESQPQAVSVDIAITGSIDSTQSIAARVEVSSAEVEAEAEAIDDGWNGPRGAAAVHMGAFKPPVHAQVQQESANYLTRSNLIVPYQFLRPAEARAAHSMQTQRGRGRKVAIATVIKRARTASRTRIAADSIDRK